MAMPTAAFMDRRRGVDASSASMAAAHAADEAPVPRLDPVRVPKNTTLTYPTSKDSWREAYVQVASELGGRVVAALVFAEEAQAPFIGRVVANVGKIDPKRHLENDLNDLMASNIVQCLGTMLSTVVF